MCLLNNRYHDNARLAGAAANAEFRCAPNTCADDLTNPRILHVVTEADGCRASEQGGLLTSCLFRNAVIAYLGQRSTN